MKHANKQLDIQTDISNITLHNLLLHQEEGPTVVKTDLLFFLTNVNGSIMVMHYKLFGW